MSDNNSPPQTPPSPLQRRRSSFAEFFGSRSGTGTGTASGSPPNSATPAFPSTIASAAQAQQNRRRMSISTIGVSGNSPTNTSPFNAFARRRGSISSSQSSSSPPFEEAVVEESESTTGPANASTTPFARRVSFGAQAYRDLHRSGSVNSGNNGRRPSLATLTEITNQSTTPRSPPSATTTPRNSRGEGFNWGESMRDKAGRAPSGTFGSPGSTKHGRAATVATVEPPKTMPQAPPQPTKPDVLGERMLRGDFMMD